MPAASGPIDIVILSNGPGEVATWVKPVVQALQQRSHPQKAPLQPQAQAAQDIRISVLLSPCPHASGQEHTTVAAYPEVDRVQSAPNFFKFLLTGKTADNWDWHPQGVVVFLGGDQLYTVLVAKRLGYRTVTYAEWDARWTGWIDSFGVMQPELIQKAPASHQHKFAVVGDLMADVPTTADRTEITAALESQPDAQLIGFLPGSKSAKLSTGLPLLLAVTQRLHAQHAANDVHTVQRQYIIGVAPNVTLAELERYADPSHNAGFELMQGPATTLVKPPTGLPYFQLEEGPKIFLWQRFPALDLFSQCTLCFTTVGANTAQLGALAIPMIVVIPTQRLDGIKHWDGWPGLLFRLPGVSAIARHFINPLILRAIQKSGRLFAWPNIWAKREVVPELFGPITATEVSDLAQDYLTHPTKLADMRQTLRNLRGPSDAANKMADLILETVNYPK